MELESGVKGVRRSFLLRGDPKNEGHSGGLILFIESQVNFASYFCDHIHLLLFCAEC